MHFDVQMAFLYGFRRGLDYFTQPGSGGYFIPCSDLRSEAAVNADPAVAVIQFHHAAPIIVFKGFQHHARGYGIDRTIDFRRKIAATVETVIVGIWVVIIAVVPYNITAVEGKDISSARGRVTVL